MKDCKEQDSIDTLGFGSKQFIKEVNDIFSKNKPTDNIRVTFIKKGKDEEH